MAYNPTVMMGVELEVEVQDNPDAAKHFTSNYVVYGSYPKHHVLSSTHKKHGNIIRVVDTLCEGLVTVHYDNTINDGFELIGIPMSCKDNISVWNKLLSDGGVAPYIHGDDVKETPGNGYGTHDVGMHVHVSGDPITPMTMGKLLMFFNVTANKSFITYMAGRPLGRFCETQPKMKVQNIMGLYHTSTCSKKTKRGSKIVYKTNGTWDAYKSDGTPCCAGGVKLQHSHFVRGAMWVAPALNTGDYEIRIFKSTVKPERFNANLEFCVALVEFSHQAKVNELTHKEFCDWMSEIPQRIQYPNLFKYLRKGGYVKGLVPQLDSLRKALEKGLKGVMIKGIRSAV